MNIPYVRGVTARQAHVAIPEGTIEEEFARGGFFGRYAHLYKENPSTAWCRIEGSLKPRAYDMRLAPEGRTPMLENADARISWERLARPMDHYFRNADGDELRFCHRGAGRIETDFGPLEYGAGDYLALPRGATYRLVPSEPSAFLLLEAAGELTIPERGLLGEHALFDPAVLEVPTPCALAPCATHAGEFEVRIQREGEITSVFYRFNPLATAGWKGTLAPFKLATRDIRPVASERYHLPPSAHATFQATGLVVCTFLPRPLETGDPRAMKVPFVHANIDFDEVLFYHSGEFFSREGIREGMLTFHPQGIHHGPQPGAVGRTGGATRTEEVAVMIDTRRPLRPAAAAPGFEQTDYWKSWIGKAACQKEQP